MSRSTLGSCDPALEGEQLHSPHDLIIRLIPDGVGSDKQHEGLLRSRCLGALETEGPSSDRLHHWSPDRYRSESPCRCTIQTVPDTGGARCPTRKGRCKHPCQDRNGPTTLVLEGGSVDNWGRDRHRKGLQIGSYMERPIVTDAVLTQGYDLLRRVTGLLAAGYPRRRHKPDGIAPNGT